MSSLNRDHWKASGALLAATVVWALSFPFIKTILTTQQGLAPEAGTWFLSSLLVTTRFALASAVLLVWCGRSLAGMTRSELVQGAGLGVAGGLGLIFQGDGLAYTAASTSAFITQLYVVLIPLWTAVCLRRRPSWVIWTGALMVLAGIGVLARVDWQLFRLGRGEVETLLSSVFFTVQILWLDRPAFAKNRVGHFTVVMFVVTALLFLPVALATAPSIATVGRVFESGMVWALVGMLTLGCTIFSYSLMNRWQPRVDPAEAGMIYAVEPLFASGFALFLPGWFSSLSGIAYANESLTIHLLIGGALITGANLLIQWRRGR